MVMQAGAEKRRFSRTEKQTILAIFSDASGAGMRRYTFAAAVACCALILTSSVHGLAEEIKLENPTNQFAE